MSKNSSMNPHNNSTIGQLFRYTIVGAIAFLVDFGGLWFLTEFVGFDYLWSAAISFILGLLTNYWLSTRWVFSINRFDNRLIESLIFAFIGIIGLGLNELIIYISSNIIGLYYLFGKVVSTIIVFFWNFFARKIVLFQK